MNSELVNGIVEETRVCIGCDTEFQDYRDIERNPNPDPMPVCNGCIATMEPCDE
jgi:hypothetical protein